MAPTLGATVFRYSRTALARRLPSSMLYASVPRSSQWPSMVTVEILRSFKHLADALTVFCAVADSVYSLKSKYAGSSLEQSTWLAPAAHLPLTQAPLLQSLSLAQEAPSTAPSGRMQVPAMHLWPTGHWTSAVHSAAHLLFRHCLPVPQSSLDVQQSGLRPHAPPTQATQRSVPAPGQWLSNRHCAHLLSTQYSPFALQCVSVSQLG